MKLSKSIGTLNALILICAIIAMYCDYQNSSWFLLFKPLTTGLVMLIPVLAKKNDKAFRKWLIVALCFCLLGDVLLLKPDYFVFGLGAFLIAHLFFTMAFIGINGFQRNPLVLLVLLFIGAGLYSWLYPDLGELKIPVAAYVLVILFMVWQAVGLYVQQRTMPYGFIALGALLFMFSDSMIAVNKFKAPFALSGFVILSTYWLAIALLGNSVFESSEGD